MVQTVYGDVLFLVNFSMDIISLYICSRIFHYKLTPFRALAAASIGSIYAVASLFMPDILPVKISAGIAVFLAMNAVAFAGGHLKGSKKAAAARFFGSAFALFGIQALFGGIMTALFNFLNSAGVYLYFLNSSNGSGSRFILISLGVIAAMLSAAAGALMKRRANRKIVSLEIGDGGRSWKTEAVLDTGNFVREPLGGRPVIFVRSDCFDALLDSETASIIERSDLRKFADAGNPGKIRIVCCESVAGCKTLLGYIPDKITIDSARVDALISPAGNASRSLGENGGIVPSELL